jgi:hypothetical protein
MSNTKKQYPEQATPITYGQMLGGAVVTPYVQGQQVAATYGANGIGTQQSGTVSVPVSAPTVTYSGNIDTGSGTQGVATPTTPTQVPLYQQHAEEQRQMAYDAAAQSRQNALVQNAATYQQGLSTYGARADSLGRMGLAGSGYADYLSGQAYVAKVNADSAARAVEAQAQQQAQATYAQNLERGRQQAEAQLLDAINMGATPSQVKQLADSLGMSDSAYVKMATDNYNNAVQGSISAEMTDEYISSLDYDEAGKADITAKRDDATLKTIFTPDTDFDTVSKAIADARSKGTLSEDGEKSAWYSAYIGKIDNKHTDSNSWSVEDIYAMEKEIEKAFGNGQLTKPDRESALEHLYQTAGGVVDAEIANIKKIGNVWDGAQGQYAQGGKTHTVYIRRRQENADTARRLSLIAPNAQQGTVAALGDDAYIYLDGAWYYLSGDGASALREAYKAKRSTHQEKDHQK